MQIGVRQPHLREILSRLLKAGLEAVEPGDALRGTVHRRGSILEVAGRRYDLRRYARIVVVGAGKASGTMAAAIERVVQPQLTDSLVLVKYGDLVRTRKIKLVQAGHPVPDETGRRATNRLLGLVGGLTERDLLIVLLSGGASSLLVAPASDLTLVDKQRTTALLLRSGATIQHLNTVRKHLSVIKGGRLVAATKAQVVSLILSDVIGDDLGTIGSGPSAPDPTTYEEARGVLKQFGLWTQVPMRVREHIVAGCRGEYSETPKPGSNLFRRVQNVLIGNNAAAVQAVERTAKRLGLRPVVLASTLTGEAKEAAKFFGAIAREITSTERPTSRPTCLISGGELTVTVRGPGRGGRAQEFALAASMEIAGLPDMWIAGFGTDGTDGPTDVAGAVVDGTTMKRAAQAGIDLGEMLLRNDSYPVLKQLRAHIITGPTGTNVNDLYLLIAP
jgi:glycerate 2-kinase